jgi:phenylacetate-CoA ligase
MMTTLRASSIFDVSVETQDHADLRRMQENKLMRLVRYAYEHAPKQRASMQQVGVEPSDVRTLDDLHKLPIIRKDALPALQAEALPFGDLNGVPIEQLQRIFASPGNIYDPQGPEDDFWRFRAALAAAGFRAGDIVQNTFSYHLTPAGFMFDSALRALGCVVVPAGVGQTELQVRVAHDLGVSGYIGTPSFLHTLLTKARELNTPLRIEVALVAGEMLAPSLRTELETTFGVRVQQAYGTADLGCIAYECPQKDGMHLHSECLVELLDLETGKPAEPGQPGEVVVTLFDEAYPLIRFATGDISSLGAHLFCVCGRTAPKLTGILGRVGDAVKVKGMFVHGSQIDQIIKQFPEIARYQAVVTRAGHQDQIAYRVELNAPVADADAFKTRLADKLRDLLKVRGEVEIVVGGAIAQSAKKIDDQRVWR